MQTLTPVLWIWPCTAALLMLNQLHLTKLHSNSFKENVLPSWPSLQEVENFGVITYPSNCFFYVLNVKVFGVGYCPVFYEGQVQDFKREGYGEMNYADGSVYSGQWRDNKREGYGIMYYAVGNVYEGEWVADKRHGQGVLTLANNKRYLSDFHVNLLISNRVLFNKPPSPSSFSFMQIRGRVAGRGDSRARQALRRRHRAGL